MAKNFVYFVCQSVTCSSQTHWTQCCVSLTRRVMREHRYVTLYVGPILPAFLVAFPKLRKATNSFVICACFSARSHGPSCLPLEGFSLNMIFGYFSMKFLRHLLGITKLDKEKNQCIREKTGAENIVKEIKQYQEKWLQHIQRMDTNRIPKQALQYKPKGQRHIGRPRKRWRDQFHFEDTRTQESNLILPEHDDDDDDDYRKLCEFGITLNCGSFSSKCVCVCVCVL